MTKAMTGSFYLTETVLIPAASAINTRFQGTVDLSAYVNVPTGQAIAITECDFIHQVSSDYGGNVNSFFQGGNGAVTTQLTDLNPGVAFIRADNHSLIASGSLCIDDAANIATHTSDLFPDNFGPASLSEAFLVVNDTLYLTTGADGSVGTTTLADIYVTVRIRAQVVKLSTKDWMAIAIQSTAEA
jgi:hypothetical protein